MESDYKGKSMQENIGNRHRDPRCCWNSQWITSGPQMTMLAPSLAPAHYEDFRARLSPNPILPRCQSAPRWTEQAQIARGHAQYLIDTSEAHSEPQSIMRMCRTPEALLKNTDR